MNPKVQEQPADQNSTAISADPKINQETGGLVFATFSELRDFAQMLVAQGVAGEKDTWETVLIKIQSGSEIGLGAMASIQNIAVINRRPSVWGDAMLGLCQRSRVFDHQAFDEWYEFDGQQVPKTLIDDADINDQKKAGSIAAACRVRRVGGVERTYLFSMAEARRADLFPPSSKAAAWFKYPLRMLAMRARSLALRDNFADVLKGIPMAEEQLDHPESRDRVLEADPQPNQNRLEDAAARSREAREAEDARRSRTDAQSEPIDAESKVPSRTTDAGAFLHQIRQAESIERINEIRADLNAAKGRGELHAEAQEQLRAALADRLQDFRELLKEREAMQGEEGSLFDKGHAPA